MGPAFAYAGVVTRGVAFVLDLLLVAVVAVLTTVVVGVLVSVLVPGRQSLGVAEIVAAGAGCTLLWAAYLLVFWVLLGHTPGMRLMRIDVTTPRGDPLTVGRAVRRLVGLELSLLSLGLGFVPILLDDRRRALQDMIAGTVVVRREEPAEAGRPPARSPASEDVTSDRGAVPSLP